MKTEKVSAENVGSIAFMHKPTDFVTRHKHENCEIVYYRRGRGTTSVYGASGVTNFPYEGDSVVIIPAGLEHEEYAAEETEIVCNCLEIPGAQPSEACFFKKSARSGELFSKIETLMLGIHEKYARYKKGKDPVLAAEIGDGLTHLGVAVFRLINERQKGKTKYFTDFVNVVKEYIRGHYLEKINFAILAEDSGYSYDRFRHIFVEYTGMTLWAYQQSVRLNYAKRMLVVTDWQIEKLAHRCGFQDSARFCHWFGNLAGVSPLRYRNMNKLIRWGVVLNLTDISKNERANLMIDTDLGCDCDDALALAIVNVFHRERYVNVLCMTHCIADEDAGRCIDFINRFYGNDFDIGIADKATSFSGAEKYLERYVYKLRGEFDRSKKLYEALPLVKSKLRAAADKSVTMVFIGQLNNLAALLADEEGAALVRSKVCAINIMGGNFEEYGETFCYKQTSFKAEFNIGLDVKGAQAVVANTDLPLTFLDFNQGIGVLTGKVLKDFSQNPAARIYKMFGVEDRESWDVITVLYTILGGGGMFELSDSGTVHVDDDGRTTFTPGEGNHRLLRLNKAKEATEQINEIIMRTNEVIV